MTILRCIADQASRPTGEVLRRFDREPKRIATKKLYLLQSFPGVGPALAHRLLLHFGSVEKVVTASATALKQVPGVGSKKATRIRETVG